MPCHIILADASSPCSHKDAFLRAEASFRDWGITEVASAAGKEIGFTDLGASHLVSCMGFATLNGCTRGYSRSYSCTWCLNSCLPVCTCAYFFRAGLSKLSVVSMTVRTDVDGDTMAVLGKCFLRAGIVEGDIQGSMSGALLVTLSCQLKV